MGDTVPRFSRGERWAHRSLGLLMGSCLLTAFALYYGPISLAVGHRHTVELVHVWSGYALPAPLLPCSTTANRTCGLIGFER